MAQYWWTPASGDIGSSPTGWSDGSAWDADMGDAIVGEDAATSELYLEFSNLNKFKQQAWFIDSIDGTSLGSITDAELFFVIDFMDGQGSVSGLFRAEKTVRSGVVTEFFERNGDIRLDVFDDGSDASIGSASIPDYDTARVNYRSRAIGTDVKSKIWFNSVSEPASWDIEATNTERSVSGALGVHSGWEGVFRIIAIGVGTGGDSAPSTAPVTGPNTPINSSITNLLATSARLNWEQV